MEKSDPGEGAEPDPGVEAPPQGDVVSSVERIDYVETANPAPGRRQSLEGFDPDYRDIVDYIARCTHGIWEEKNVGLIYSHYTHNCVVYLPNETLFDREQVVEATIQRIVTMPDRGMATQIVWRGDDVEGFYTSHLVTVGGTPHAAGPVWRADRPRFLLPHNRGLHDLPQPHLPRMAGRRLHGGHPAAEPRPRADRPRGGARDAGQGATHDRPRRPSALAGTISARGRGGSVHRPTDHTRRWSSRHCTTPLNRRMFGRMRDLYSATAQYHGPPDGRTVGRRGRDPSVDGPVRRHPGRELFAAARLLGLKVPRGGWKIAVRWIVEGRHSGYGSLAALGRPTDSPVRLMGMSHYHYCDGEILEEWTVYDEMSLLTQIRLHDATHETETEGADRD